MMEKRSQRSDTVRRVAIAFGAIAVLAAAAYEVFQLVNGETDTKKRVVEVVQLKLIPPPPPPKVEPPPEPPKIVEQKIQPPVDKPDDKPKEVKQEQPPPGPLALDAKGGPGSDAFGLGGKPGGSDYVGTGNGAIGGDGTGGARWNHYASMVAEQIQKRLHEDQVLDVGKFRAAVKIWLTSAGKVQKVEMLNSTGDNDIDARIRESISGMPAMPEAPSPEMPQPLKVRMTAVAQQ